MNRTRWLGRIAMILAAGLAASAPPARAADAGATLSLAQLRAAYALPNAHIARIDGIDVYYADEGTGPAILLCNGSSSSLRSWDRLTALLARDHRVIRFDIPPTDLSGSVPKSLVGKVHPADIPAGLLDKLGITHVTAIGVSSGGTMVVQLAALRPHLVDRLILSNTPSDPVRTDGMVLSPALARETKAFKASGHRSLAYWNAFWDFFSGDPARIPSSLRQQYYDMNRREREPVDPLILAAKVEDHAEALSNFAAVHAPTLLVWGERDPLLTPPTEKVLANYLVNAQVSVLLLPDVGHYPPIEVPERFARIVRDFVNAVTPETCATPTCEPK